MHDRLVLWRDGVDHAMTELLAKQMLDGPVMPLRMYYTALRPSASQLSVDGDLFAAVAQWQGDNAALNVSAALDASMTAMMAAS
jgi:hypothetical protein